MEPDNSDQPLSPPSADQPAADGPAAPLDITRLPDSNMLDHSQFMAVLADRFPEASGAIDKYGDGLLHCEVAAFRQVAEQAMDEGRFWDVERYFRFVEEALADADAAVANAIEISFIEDFALGAYTEQRHRAIRERVSKSLREKIAAISDHWR